MKRSTAFLLKCGVLLILLTCTGEAWVWHFRNDFRRIGGGLLIQLRFFRERVGKINKFNNVHHRFSRRPRNFFTSI